MRSTRLRPGQPERRRQPGPHVRRHRRQLRGAQGRPLRHELSEHLSPNDAGQDHPDPHGTQRPRLRSELGAERDGRLRLQDQRPEDLHVNAAATPSSRSSSTPRRSRSARPASGSSPDPEGNGHRVLHLPVTIVRGQEDVTLTKTCEPTALPRRGTTTCTVTAENPTFEDVTYSIRTAPPRSWSSTAQRHGRHGQGQGHGRRQRHDRRRPSRLTSRRSPASRSQWRVRPR